MEEDHPETYADRAEAIGVFADFACSARILLASADDDGARQVAAAVAGSVHTITVGQSASADADARVVALFIEGATTRVTLSWQGELVTLRVPVPGIENAMKRGRRVHGRGRPRCRPGAPGRRAELLEGSPAGAGREGGVQARDSYAHRPTAISADIKAARTLTGDGGRVVVVVEPSGRARTAAMGHELGVALAGADEVVLLPVHSLLADSPISLADVETIARAITAHGTRVHRGPDIASAGEAAYVTAAAAAWSC